MMMIRSTLMRRGGSFRTAAVAMRGFASATTTPPPPSIEGPWLSTMSTCADGSEEKRFLNFFDNQFVPTASSTSDDHVAYTVRNPATQDVLGVVPETSASDFDAAVARAKRAFTEWSQVPVPQRQRVMLRYQALLRERSDELAACLTAENGKTLADAAGDVFRGLEVVETAGAAVSFHMQGDSLRGLSSTVDCISYRRPLGVVAGICPFNFPAMIVSAFYLGRCMFIFPCITCSLACTVWRALVFVAALDVSTRRDDG